MASVDLRLFDDHGDETAVRLNGIHGVGDGRIVVDRIARAEIHLVAREHDLHVAGEHVVELLPLMVVRGLGRARGVVFHGDDERLRLLVAEVVGQVFVMVGLAAVERQPLARAGEDVALEFRAFAGGGQKYLHPASMRC